jgi:hypothetical protein
MRVFLCVTKIAAQLKVEFLLESYNTQTTCLDIFESLKDKV